jgi:hypothetical protein
VGVAAHAFKEAGCRIIERASQRGDRAGATTPRPRSAAAPAPTDERRRATYAAMTCRASCLLPLLGSVHRMGGRRIETRPNDEPGRTSRHASPERSRYPSDAGVPSTCCQLSSRRRAGPGRDSCSAAERATCGCRRSVPLAARLDCERERSSGRHVLRRKGRRHRASALARRPRHRPSKGPAIMRRRERAGNDTPNTPDNAPPVTVAVSVVW